MKTMTCNQLGGACDNPFSGNTFEEIAEQSKQHGMEMFQKGDPAHMEAMQAMQNLIQDPMAMMAWMDGKKELFESLPDD